MKRLISAFAVVVMLSAATSAINALSPASDASISMQAQGTTVTAVKFTSSGTALKNSSAIKEVTDDGVYMTVSGAIGKATASDRSGYTYMVTLKNGTWYFN